MSAVKPPQPDYDRAVHYQTLAADPSRSVFVSANAGSGKTHVLVNRVSRILLSNSDVTPQDILCLTYTKAAASEMQTRLFQTLGEWSVMPEAALREKLNTLYNRPVDIDLGEARQLFAKALETPEGLKVQTIHAFCERVLSRFPVEAGILPGFEPLDDSEASALFGQVWQGLIERAYANPHSDLALALNDLVANDAPSTVEALRNWMAYNVPKIEDWVSAGGVEPLRARLGIAASETEDSLKAKVWAAVDKTLLKPAATALVASGKKQAEKGQLCLDALAETDPIKAFDLYARAIFKKSERTPTGQIGGKTMPDAVTEFFGDYNSVDSAEMQGMARAGQDLSALTILRRTETVFIIAKDFAATYKVAKASARVLDFSDQILLVRNLLTRSEVSEWVRYKMDMGIKHILVDEAQDTAPEQWDIIDALADAFEHDEKDRHLPRTLFAVGDEKQSIYSFQGADPTVFIGKSQFETEPDNAIRMRMSFRSAPAVLEAVDAVFVGQGGLQQMFGADYVPPASDLITHTAKREIPGLVELWPLSPPPVTTEDEVPYDPRPVDTEGQDGAREKLARAIATQVKDWIDKGELITKFDKSAVGGAREVVRPMQAGDVLILVRKRSGAFFNAVIRNLKRAGVPVAGADRLILSDSIAVQDLMSLARFVCLPEDDLALAEALKSPLFNISETQLFEVAAGRKGRLWPALKHSDQPWAKDVVTALTSILSASRRLAPYEFFETVLNRLLPDGTSTVRQFYARLSMEVEDPIAAFLAKALAHQRQSAPSLQHFVHSFGGDTGELKREMDGSHNQVRVMTVYGAKGLEAPVVILPDTTQIPGARDATDNGLLNLDDNTFARLGGGADTPEVLETIKEARVKSATEEYLRLLYVAMTRAESRLLICGYKSGRVPKDDLYPKAPEGSWHDWAARALMSLDGCYRVKTPFDVEGEGGIAGLAYGARPVLGGTDETVDNVSVTADLPSWITTPCEAPRLRERRVTPSHLLAPPPGLDAPLRSPLETPVPVYRRGMLIHKLLELLPDVTPDARRNAAARFLDSHGDLPQSLRDDIETVVFSVLDNPAFEAIFAPGTRAEISLAGRADSLPASVYLNAQIDRLSVSEAEVFIVDYKSNRPPPTDPHDVSPSYLGQMAAYREMARTLYPTRTVTCGLLWTDGPHMMILPDALLDAALEQIPK
ncbi:double-strand break repair helicase AddA [Fretibacter rubidus]|uniref:double-strand break repair helicase AddA n=1 Tax=Fretibacter rubidus TaxID=570162 RepID=UPI00352B7B72